MFVAVVDRYRINAQYVVAVAYTAFSRGRCIDLRHSKRFWYCDLVRRQRNQYYIPEHYQRSWCCCCCDIPVVPDRDEIECEPLIPAGLPLSLS